MTRRTDGPVYYLDTEDTLEEVDITRRQLSYWREKGLITPELGPDAKGYTERDIRQLKYLRRLIVDLGFPPDLIKKLMPVGRSGKPRDISAFPYLDLIDLTLKTKKELSERLWHEFGATAEEWEIEQRLYALALLLFGLARSKNRSTQTFMARRDEILETIRELSVVARLVGAYEDPDEPNHLTGLVISPRLPDDIDLNNPEKAPEIGRLVKKHGERLDGFQEVWRDLAKVGERADIERYIDGDVGEFFSDGRFA